MKEVPKRNCFAICNSEFQCGCTRKKHDFQLPFLRNMPCSISAAVLHPTASRNCGQIEAVRSALMSRPPASVPPLSRCGSINPFFLLFRKVKCTRTTCRRRRRKRALQKSAKHKAFLEDGRTPPLWKRALSDARDNCRHS